MYLVPGSVGGKLRVASYPHVPVVFAPGVRIRSCPRTGFSRSVSPATAATDYPCPASSPPPPSPAHDRCRTAALSSWEEMRPTRLRVADSLAEGHESSSANDFPPPSPGRLVPRAFGLPPPARTYNAEAPPPIAGMNQSESLPGPAAAAPPLSRIRRCARRPMRSRLWSTGCVARAAWPVARPLERRQGSQVPDPSG